MKEPDKITGPGQPRVVKKVVKRTVVRPQSSSAARQSLSPSDRVRGGAVKKRSATSTRSAASGSTSNAAGQPEVTGQPEVVPAASRSAATDQPKRSTVATVAAKPTLNKAVAAKPTPKSAITAGTLGDRGRRLAERARSGTASVAGGSKRLATRTLQRSHRGYRAVRAYRLPPQPPIRSAIVVGSLLGLLMVVVGWLSGLVFSEFRGTSGGGPVWGGLVVVGLVALTTWLGARALRVLNVEHAMTVAILASLFALILVLLFFLDLAAGGWAWLVMPLVMAGSYGLSYVLVRVGTAKQIDDAHGLTAEADPTSGRSS